MRLIAPQMESHRYDTYGVVMPKATHTKVIKCEAVTTQCSYVRQDESGAIQARCPFFHCTAWAHGWITTVDVSTALGQQQARYIIDHCGRHWTSRQNGHMVSFHFPENQQCFAEHRVPLEREPLFTFKNVHQYAPGERAMVINGFEWLERFGENQLKLKEIQDKG